MITLIYNQQDDMNKEDQNFEKIESNETMDSKITQSHRHFGLVLPLGMLSTGEPKYVLGPHYWVFLITLVITSIIFIIMGYSIASSAKVHQLWVSLLITLSMCFYIYSYIKVGFSNPGIASSDSELDEEQQRDLRYCRPCKIIRPLGTVHCYSCDICIHGYDHHCPWIGKCVGKYNMCDFKRFLFSIMVALCTFAACIYFSGESDNQQKIQN